MTNHNKARIALDWVKHIKRHGCHHVNRYSHATSGKRQILKFGVKQGWLEYCVEGRMFKVTLGPIEPLEEEKKRYRKCLAPTRHRAAPGNQETS